MIVVFHQCIQRCGLKFRSRFISVCFGMVHAARMLAVCRCMWIHETLFIAQDTWNHCSLHETTVYCTGYMRPLFIVRDTWDDCLLRGIHETTVYCAGYTRPLFIACGYMKYETNRILGARLRLEKHVVQHRLTVWKEHAGLNQEKFHCFTTICGLL